MWGEGLSSIFYEINGVSLVWKRVKVRMFTVLPLNSRRLLAVASTMPGSTLLCSTLRVVHAVVHASQTAIVRKNFTGMIDADPAPGRRWYAHPVSASAGLRPRSVCGNGVGAVLRPNRGKRVGIVPRIQNPCVDRLTYRG